MKTVFEGAPSACVLLAVASIPENRPKAIRHCLKRARVVLAKLSAPPASPEKTEAIEALHLRCRLCRMCVGLEVTQREPQRLEG